MPKQQSGLEFGHKVGHVIDLNCLNGCYVQPTRETFQLLDPFPSQLEEAISEAFSHPPLYSEIHGRIYVVPRPFRFCASTFGAVYLTTLHLESAESIRDSFCGLTLFQTHHVDTIQDSLEEKLSFVLQLPKRHRHALFQPYLHHLTARAEEFERVSRERQLFTNNGHASYDSGWVSISFRYPSTFETLSLEPQLKNQLTGDLTASAEVKSSLITAIDNYLCYDVYDLELTKVSDNSELQQQIISNLTSKARLRSSRKQAQQKQDNDEQNDGMRVTLSRLLNFTDNLWSCCGDKRPGVAALWTHGRPRQPRHLRSPRLPAAGKELLRARCPPTIRSSKRVREVERGTHAGPGGRDSTKEQRGC
ncbi:hypothetical protein ACFX2A_014659 [Malus domestica]